MVKGQIKLTVSIRKQSQGKKTMFQLRDVSLQAQSLLIKTMKLKISQVLN